MKINVWIDAEDEIIEIEDGLTEEEIREEFDSWFNGVICCGWCIVEDDE